MTQNLQRRERDLFTHPAVLWSVFIVAHVWVIWVGVAVTPGALGDISGVYRFWVDNAVHGTFIAGVTTVWVYPIVAWAPIALASIAGLNNYVLAWLIMVTIGDLIAFFYLVRGYTRPAPRALAAWWWSAAILALGPIVLGRLDSVATPLAIWSLLFVVTRPRLTGVLMAIGAWIKVSPGALLIAAVLMVRTRWRILTGFIVTSAVVVLAALIAGAGVNVLSFIGYQSSRGLQIESPAATPFLWLVSQHQDGAEIYFDGEMLTYQVKAPGVDVVASAMTWVMLLVVVLTIGGIIYTTRSRIAPVIYLPAASLAMTTALIAFNKVGSPQYITWLIPPVIAGLVLDRHRFIGVAGLTLVLAFLTQLIYPWMYDQVVRAQPLGLTLLSVRNLLELALFAWAVVLLVRPRLREGEQVVRLPRHSR